ncbi:uncharacterized protein LOC130446417 [Diorhabda sublineata]|uniref:uncharacterized protein LOC130446417 n=1 Tax=Diorhabda sublineata TaxID=1163346 RepID=UPI0024E16EA7|nr:uncharacterized protein LOC130446417 [Diorhabda sublineata]
MESTDEIEKPRKRDTSRKIYKNPSNYNFNCECGKNFNYKKHYNDHRRKVHKDHSDSRTEPPVKPQKGCPLCDFKSKYREEMVKHFETNHNISLVQEKLSFTTKDDFLIWKNDIEVRTASKYISENGSQVFRKHVITKYTCHRSGYYIPHKKKGLRHLKKQGSVKINGFCPANITLQLQNNGSCIVTFIGTHIGHDNNLKHLSLTPLERENIARKLSMKIPFDQILDNIKDSSSDSSQQRIHLLTRKDLYNIQASFNLSSKTVRHKNITVNIDAFIKQLQISNECILYYKPNGVYAEDVAELKLDDFLLIIMTPAQLDLLIKYGHDCICLNGTHGVKKFDLELNTLMILDELREGFPCAFLISNRLDLQVLSLFFSKIKSKVGIIKPKIFMSDLSDTYYIAWCNVMGIPEKRLLCTWHIDYWWRDNLSKINNKQTQALIYKHLRTLLTERDVNTFQKMLIQFCHIDDPDSSEFITYFRNNFVNNNECWAYCHRLHAGINTNMHLERMHKSINFIFLKEKRLDKGITAMLKFLKDKLMDEQKINQKGKVCIKLSNIELKHKHMEEMDGSTLKAYDHGWEVLSDKGCEMYLVQQQETNCINCQLVCTECGICIHQFVCTCLDSAIKYNMCKHIHLVAKYINNNHFVEEQHIVEIDENDDGQEDGNIDNGDNNEDTGETFLGELNPSKIPDLDDRKEMLIKSIIDTINSISSMQELEIIEKQVSIARSTLINMKNFVSKTVSVTETQSTPIDLEQHLMEHKIERHFMVNSNLEKSSVCSICMKRFKNDVYHQRILTDISRKNEICMDCGKGLYNRRDQLGTNGRFHEIKYNEQVENVISKEHEDLSSTRTTHVTISVSGAQNSHIQIPVQIPVTNPSLTSTIKGDDRNILSL